MLYDLPIHASEYQAPAQSSIILRSQVSEKGSTFPRPQLNQPVQTILRHPNITVENVEHNLSEAVSTYAVPVVKTVEPKSNMSTRSGVDVDKFTQFLTGITRQTSTKRCARSIRIGLQSAGAKIVNHPVAAADWGNTLMKIGYRKIDLSFDQPKKGDIYIIDRNSSSQYGHIAAYSGKAWVSDYKQNSHAVYRNPNVNYTYYRLAEH